MTLRLPDSLIDALRRARSLGVITGAGVSAESGISTYRGQGGIYDDPVEGERTVEALSGSTLRADPDRTWRALAKLAQQAVGARPNPAHAAIAELERKVERFVLLTQNVDGLHQAAGSRNVIAIHGNVSEALCTFCQVRVAFESPEDLAKLEGAPECKMCGSALRPNAVLFGEMLPEDELGRLHRELHADPPDVVIVAGTTALFPYIAAPVVTAKRAGRVTVEVNPERTDLTDLVDYYLEGKAGDVMPAIARSLHDVA